MSTDRPTVSAKFVAAMIDSTPDRVRRRLDRTPDVAASWNWQVGDTAWSVHTGGETVTLPLGHITAIEQLACSCLLSPRCFHVLACLTHLQVAIDESVPEAKAEQIEDSNSDEDFVTATVPQQNAVRDLMKNLAWLLRVGVANAGVVVQSGLLRAVHQCRAEGLHRLGGLGLRILAGASEFRTRAPAADPGQLAEDLADALETSRHVLSPNPIASFWIGTARRKQLPVRPRKLLGLFAEPLITRGGYSGAAVYFLGEDDRIYTASDVRPGDAQHARDTYLGGIEIGSMVQPAKQLARGLYLGTDLTASADGRLGRGKGIKIVEQGQSTWQAEAIQVRFQRPLPEQWNMVYAQTALPADARPAGWDFVYLEGTVLGALGPELLFQSAIEARPIRLAIENENEGLCYRENLRMLSHAPGLTLQIIARMNLREPRIICPLAVAQVAGEQNSNDERRKALWPVSDQATGEVGDTRRAPLNEPRLEISPSMGDRICMGFDEIQRHQLLNAEASPIVLSFTGVPAEGEQPLGSLRRRWIATMLAGIASERSSNSKMLTADIANFSRNGFSTGAALLDALSRSTTDKPDTFLATAIYLRSCEHELAKSRAMLE